MVLALSTSAFAQNSDEDEWISADSNPSATTESKSGSYDGSNDSEFANDEEDDDERFISSYSSLLR